jgi:hypothetical protein
VESRAYYSYRDFGCYATVICAHYMSALKDLTDPGSQPHLPKV